MLRVVRPSGVVGIRLCVVMLGSFTDLSDCVGLSDVFTNINWPSLNQANHSL